MKNVPASVRARLLNKARKEGRPFQEVLQYFAMERFLYRLTRSLSAERFILKGALMMRVWNVTEARPTMDIDMLGRADNAAESILSEIKAILDVEVEPDGLRFDPLSLATESITAEAEYEGVRVHFRGFLDSARVDMQIDLGFGDPVYPKPEKLVFPGSLGFPSPILLCYSRESAVAEKFEAMVKHRELNSRMKDFYDLWVLSRAFEFQGNVLSEAIRQTFQKRKTILPPKIVAFTEDFVDLKQVQWIAFRKRLSRELIPDDFGEIVGSVKNFIEPISEALLLGATPPELWLPPGPWKF